MPQLLGDLSPSQGLSIFISNFSSLLATEQVLTYLLHRFLGGVNEIEGERSGAGKKIACLASGEACDAFGI
jgi:hypothetical protein